ncbi:MAG: peptidoglycan-binding protein, partial [Clostridiales bacterium]|nr:peptidoglycan-binding protein [Clostridiales bacterium]
MLKRIAALLLALLLMIPAVQIAAAEPDKNLSKNGSYIIGSTGDGVKDIQTLLKGLGYYSGSITGKYTSATATAVRWFQRSNNLPVDGKVGKKTLAALKDPGAVKATDPTAKNTTANGSLTIGSTGQEVANVQQALKDLHYYSGPVDGLFSEDTAAAVKAFQKNNNLTADGVVGAYTMLKLMTGIPWAEEFDHETLTTTYPLPAPAAVGQTQNGSYYKGASGTVIKTYQQKLKDLEYYEGDIDGDFDAEFEAAVKLFQSRNG